MTILGANVQDMSVDQLAGAIVLVLGAVGSLLLVIWQSRCLCKCRLGCSDSCYIFDCERAPPPDGAGEADAPRCVLVNSPSLWESELRVSGLPFA